jgi:hypothetical protein
MSQSRFLNWPSLWANILFFSKDHFDCLMLQIQKLNYAC